MGSTPDEMQPVPFGKSMRKTQFSYAKGYTPLNHGSYGASPNYVRRYQQDLQDEAEARPDLFIRQKVPKLRDESLAAIAPLLSVSADEVVFVPNATTGINTVLRNLTFKEGDTILYFSTIYDACEKTVQYICESTPASSVRWELNLPMEDSEILATFDHAVASLQKTGKWVKLAIFDTISTFPGVRLPWEKLVTKCNQYEILSLIDGAHGIGHIELTHLGTVSPDFFTTNLYKWLFTPRGSAFLYVPKRNQHLIRSSLPTSHGFQPKGDGSATPSRFVELFASVGTKEMVPFLCVPKALAFRMEVCGGEQNIRAYCNTLARRGGQRVADMLGTRVMGTLEDCSFAMVQLPLRFNRPGSQSPFEWPTFEIADCQRIIKFFAEKAMVQYDTFIPVGFHNGYMWARISAQVYLEECDFEYAGKVLRELCERAEKGEMEYEDAGCAIV